MKKGTKRIPRILKINSIEKSKLWISVLFSTGEDRILDFKRIFNEVWKVKKNDHEYKLYNPNEFAKVSLEGHTLCWNNVKIFVTRSNGKKIGLSYDVGADTLYDLSEPDTKRSLSIGAMFKKVRLAAHLSQETVARLSGTSRTYITKLESDKQDIELMTLKKIVEAGLQKRLEISIL